MLTIHRGYTIGGPCILAQTTRNGVYNRGPYIIKRTIPRGAYNKGYLHVKGKGLAPGVLGCITSHDALPSEVVKMVVEW